MLRNQLVLTVFRVQVQQMMRLTEHLAALVQLAHGNAHIVEFGVIGQVDEFPGAQADVIDTAEGREEGDDDGGGRREAADGQRAFDDTADTDLQPMLALQRKRGAAEVIGPVPFLPGRDVLDVPLRPFRELDGGHLHHPVLLGGIHDMDALVDGTEGDAVVVPAVGFKETVFAAHAISKGSGRSYTTR